MSTFVSACAPPLRIFIIGTGSTCAFGPPKERNKERSAEFADALATASDAPRIAFAPSRDLLGVPSSSIIVVSIKRCSLESNPMIFGAISLFKNAIAFSTPLPKYLLPPSLSSDASNAPVDAPLGTAARA